MSATPLTAAECFAQIIANLVAMLGARLERPGKPGLAGPLTFAIYLRLIGMRNRIARFAARFAAGTLRPPRPRPARPRRPRTTPGKWDHLPKPPRGRMWLLRLLPGSGVSAGHLKILLDDPEMQAMIAAAPQIGRTLRPFWYMLSPDPLPKILQRPRQAAAAPDPPPAPRPPRTPPPAPRRARPSPPRRTQAPEVAAPAAPLPAPA